MLSLMMPERRATYGPDHDFWYTPIGGRTRAGVDVNEQIALTFSTVFLCNRIISEPTSAMPIICYRRNDKGDREIVDSAEVPNQIPLKFPNDDMQAASFRQTLTLHQVNWPGGGFAEIIWDSSRKRRVEELWPIHPSRVSQNTEEKTRNEYPYLVRNAGGENMPMRRDEIFHVPGTLPDDGFWSRGVIQHARESIGGAIAVDRHSDAYWGSGGQPKGIVIAPGLRSPEDKRAFRQQWKEMHSSADSGEVVVLPKESSYTPITIPNQDHQFLETKQYSRKVICEWYRVPTYMLDDPAPTGAAVETRNALFVMHTLHPWIVNWEQQLNVKMLTMGQRFTHFFEFDFTSLRRGDVQTRMNAYRVGLCTGVYTVNDCRRMEGLPGVGPAGDVHYVPANLFTVDQMEHGNPSGSVSTGPAPTSPGSDHNGSPADNPLDHQPSMSIHDDPAAFFDSWRRSHLTKAQGDELQRQLSTLQRQISDAPSDWREMARMNLSHSLKRLLTKEANAAQRVADSRGDFDAWLREFYGKHRELLVEALAPACFSLRLAGVKELGQPVSLAAWLVAKNTEELRAAFDRDSKEAFAKRLAAWPVERVERLTEEILKG